MSPLFLFLLIATFPVFFGADEECNVDDDEAAQAEDNETDTGRGDVLQGNGTGTVSDASDTGTDDHNWNTDTNQGNWNTDTNQDNAALSDDVTDTGSDDDVVGKEDPDDQGTPGEQPDTGASFERTEDGVTIQVGEDETRSLVAIHYFDTQDSQSDFWNTDEVRYYLVPEGTDWSDASWDTQFDVPGQDETEYEGRPYTLEEFEESQGLELIGVVDVKGVPNETGDPDDRVGELTSNAPIKSYYLSPEIDSTDLYLFLPEDYVAKRNGVEEVSVSQSTAGTTGTDWLTAEVDGIELSGLGGDDILGTDNANVTLNGGPGDDTLEATGVNVVLNGGEGDDEVRTVPALITHGVPSSGSSLVDLGAGDDKASVVNSTVYGGTGTDYINGISNEEETLLYGEEGDDIVIASGMVAMAYGGAGDDVVAANKGATAYGGGGNDHIRLESGTTGYGGAGDDIFTVWNQFRDEAGPATITTGEGDDTIDARVWNAYGGETDDIYLRVTDFNPAEDILQVDSFQTANEVQDVEIVEADDSSYTDVRVTYTGTQGLAPGIAVIRLEGTTGMSADQIIIR